MSIAKEIIDSMEDKGGYVMTAAELSALGQLEGNKSFVEKLKKWTDAGGVKHRLGRALTTNIAPIPEVKNPERREKAKHDYRYFNEAYFSTRFHLRWCEDHISLMEHIQNSIIYGGGSSAYAFPRGTGKTSLAETAALWALLNNHKHYTVIVGATAGHSSEILHSITNELEGNTALFEDYPEVCYPYRCIEGAWLRMKAQHVDGVRTQIVSSKDTFVFPYIEGKPSSGNTIQCVSITGRLRGLKRSVVNTGQIIRPDLVLIDDPQTDKSAKSPGMVSNREKIIVGAILGLAGPQEEVTAIMPCTVIANNDLAERFLDREKRPDWQGKRTKMLVSFPENMDFWREYAEIQAESYRNGTYGREATEFYKQNREVMDKGAVVSWTERYNPKTELSAIQHAMNLWIKDPRAFAAEYQNEPLIESNADGDKLELNPKEIIQRISGYQFGSVPRQTELLTAGVDIQKRIIYYTITAWTADYGGVIVDYGTFPRQEKDYYSATNPPVPLDSVYPDLLLAPQIFGALQYLNESVFSRQFKRDEAEGDSIRVEKVLIDANWDQAADAVYAFTKQQQTSNIYMPSHGKGIIASMLPMDQWIKKTGERVGTNWRIRLNTVMKNRGKHVLYDTNFWKSRIAERLITGMGSVNSLMLWGDNGYRHLLLADHLSAEYSILTHGRGRDVNEWKAKASQSENHWFDCLIQSAVAASICGMAFHDTSIQFGNKSLALPIPKKSRRVLTQADLRK